MAYASASQSGYGSGPSVIHIDAAHPDVVSISDAELLFTGHLERKGPDLLLTGHDGRHHIIPGYFSAEHNADLVAPNGARITGDLINLLAGSAAPGQYAQTQSAVPTDAIGRIEKVVGNVTVMRNGVAVALHVGDAVYKNDVVQTGADSSAGIGFADGTALNLVANTRMALNDYVYDPNGSSNVALFNLVQGGFAFVAGKVAHTGDMKIGTPVATMGIRGTTGYALEQVATVNANAGNVTMSFAVVADPGSDRIGQYDLIDQFGNVVAQIGRAGIWTNVQFQGANLSPNISYTQMTASNFAVEQALVPALVQILNSINTQNLNPTPQSGPNSPGSSTPPIFELINLPQTLQQNSGTSLPISVPVNGANGPTTASGTVNINATPGPQATATVTWFSSFNGTWETATNWSDFSAPGAAQFVDIKRAVKVTIDAAEAVAGLLIGTGATLNIISGGALELLSGIANFGTLQINSTGSDPTLAINGTVYLLSSGTIALIGPTNENRIVGVGGTGATLVNVNNTIIGSGTIGQGDGALTLVNGSSGTIEATPLVAGDSGLLIINTGNPVSNSGLMTAAAGGTLHIFDSVTNFGLIQATASGTIIAAGNIDNFGEIEASGSGARVSLTGGLTNESGATVVALSGGTITLAGIITNFGTIGANGAGAIVDLEGAHISGGTLETSSRGIIEILSGTSTFSDVTLTRGSFITDADAVLLEGSTALGGTVRFEGTGPFKLEGAGAEITGESSTRVGLDNFSTISGEGKIGAGDRHFLLDNEGSGVIDATGQRALIIDNNSPGSAGTQPGNAVINTGLIEASGVGGLTIENTTISNATNAAHDTGHIRVFAESQITLDNATILHGVVSIAARGEILTAKGTSDAIETADGQDNLSTFTLRNHGTLLVSDNSSLTLASPDAINNSGTIKLDSSGELIFDQGFAGLKGGGQIIMSGGPNTLISVTTPNDQLTNFDNTISGSGTIGGNGMVLVNDGIIDADHHNAALTLDPATLTNTGTLEATNRATLVISDTTVSNGTFTFNNTINDPAAQHFTAPSGLNDSGEVVGTYTNAAGTHGFLYSDGAYATLNDPYAIHGTFAESINNAGQIVGYYYNSNYNVHGFVDNGGNYTPLNDPSAGTDPLQGTYAVGINDSGQIVGYYYDSNNDVHGFVESGGNYVPLNDPSAGTDPSQGTYATGINDSGEIVGHYIDSKGAVHGFLYSNGTFSALNDPSAVNGTYAEGINNAGQIVGYYLDASDAAHIFVYSDGAYFNYTDPSAGTGADEGTGAFAINNAGQIAGYYLDSGFNGVGFVADPPEASGTITADHGTTVDLANSTITGGTVNIAGVLDATGTSAIVDATIDNAGTIKSTGGGTLTIDAGALDNSGALKVTHGSTLDVSADVIGDGTVIIKNGGQADFTGAFDEDVTFSRAGTLALAQGYTGIVTGFGKGDAIDLTNLKYSPREYAIWNDGTLYIYKGDDATPEESIAMSGDYAANNFVVKNDAGTTEVAYRAADNWTYASSGPWHKAPDWSDGRPTPAKNAAIDGSGTYTVRITDTHPAFAQTLAIGDPDATLDGSGTLTTTRLYNTGTVRASGDQTFTINARGNGNANFGTIAALAAASLTIDNGGTTTNEIGGMVKAVGGSSALSVNNKLGGENYGHYKAADYGTVSITNHRTGVNEAGGVVEAANHGTITLNNNFNDANYGTSKADDGTFILNVADTGSGEGGNYHTAKAVSGGTFTVNGSMANWSDATITATGRGSTFNFLSGDYTTDVLNEGTIVAEHRGSVSFNDVRVHNYDAIDVDPNSKVTFDHSHVTNDGGINANTGGTITFDYSRLENHESIEAQNGGAFTFDHREIDNESGGSIGAGGGGTVTFDRNSVDNSGTIGTFVYDDPAGGTVTFDHSHINNTGLIEATLGGTLDVQTSAIDNTNTGQGIVVDGCASTFLVDAAHLRLTGGGYVTLEDGGLITENADSSLLTGLGALPALDLDNVDNTIDGAGAIGTGDGHFALENQAHATIDADVSGQTLTIDTGSHAITNAGTMEASAGSTLEIVNGTIDNTGTIALNASGDPTVLETLVPSFNFTNGALPWGGLIVNAAGDLFGTTVGGGAYTWGTVYEVAKTGGSYASTPTTLVNFNDTNGAQPYSALIADAAGDLFGTTYSGGANNDGTVFEVPYINGSYASTPTTVVSFNGANGANPYAGLIADASGDLFGTTYDGGANGDGMVFEIAKTGANYASTPTPLLSFNGANGANPAAGLIADAAGDLFGTTPQGGANSYGTVFELVNNGGGSYTPTTLVSFNFADGADPFAGLIADDVGNLFGTTTGGGANGDGKVFELVNDGGSYTLTTLVSFNGANGANPYAGLVADASGDLFGATAIGGLNGDGTVFEIAKTGGSYASTPTTLVSFNGTNGDEPTSGLITDAAGDLFGTTDGSPPFNYANGTVFELGPTPTQLEISGSLTLKGGSGGATGPGQVVLSNSSGNFIVSDGSAATLTNVDNTISGAGTIGDTHLTLHNETYGVIDADDSTPLILDTGANAIINKGTLEATSGGTLIVDSAVKGSGTDTISADATMEFQSGVSADQTVTFTAGTGDLDLTHAASFDGEIAGFTGTHANAQHSDVIDLAGFHRHSDSFSESYNLDTGILTVTQGDKTASLAFVDFTGTFAFKSDGHGGTDIFDPPANASSASISPGNDTFVFHPGMGAETAGNFNAKTDTIELDHFANIETVHQLASLISTDAQGDAVIALGHNDSITLPGTTASYLQAHLHNLVHLS